jgi:DUF438 domain-containing protein
MKLAEEDEVEAWYEEEKQKLLDSYVEQLDKGANKEAAEKGYTQKFEQLNQKYLMLIESALARKGRKTPMEKLKGKVKEKMQVVMQKVARI